MMTFFATILSVFFTLPLLGFIIVYVLFRIATKNSRKSLHKTVEYTTLFFIIAVHFLIETIWGKSLFWLLIVVILFIAMIFVLVHWKVKGEIIFSVVIKGFWRLTFIIFFLAYIVLTLFGLIQRVLTFTFFP